MLLLAYAAAAELSCGPCSTGVQEVVDAAKTNPRSQITDKVTFHTYHDMYGIFLTPLAQRAEPLKLFEIGLGCNMLYGPGASVELWTALFPRLELWAAEYDAACVRRHAKRLAHERPNLHVLMGDQGNASTLEGWVNASGGRFDAVIDDGSHRNGDILQSFALLWPHVRNGGFYFLEDLQVGRRRRRRRRRRRYLPVCCCYVCCCRWAATPPFREATIRRHLPCPMCCRAGSMSC